MKLDRNLTGNKGRGKYALVLMRRIAKLEREDREAFAEVWGAMQILLRHGALDFGDPNTEGEFFVMKLRDQYSSPGLIAYSAAAGVDDPEYAQEVLNLARRSGRFSKFCKNPD